jgi:cytochrome c553
MLISNKLRVNSLLLLFLLLTVPLSLQAKGNASAGQKKVAACEACHGTTGESVDPSYPNLAGQYESYLTQALGDYRSGARTNPVMAGMVSNLSNQDIMDLAAWYSSQEGLQDLSIK